MSVLKVEIPLSEAVRVNENPGGYQGGECIVCKASGWLDSSYGYPHYAKASSTNPNGVMTNSLFHEPNCPVGHALDEYGKPKTKPKS